MQKCLTHVQRAAHSAAARIQGHRASVDIHPFYKRTRGRGDGYDCIIKKTTWHYWSKSYNNRIPASLHIDPGKKRLFSIKIRGHDEGMVICSLFPLYSIGIGGLIKLKKIGAHAVSSVNKSSKGE